MNSKYPIVGLYEHNADAYDDVKTALIEDDVAAIVHATGTGKSYIALQLAYDNPDKKILYVVPSLGIIDHVKDIINSNPKLDFERDFPNLEFKTYQSFVNMSNEEIENIDVDLLILDEFHHIGAPIWGSRINTLIETHPDMKILGLTAYTIRDRGTVYERDIAEPDGDELFSNKVVSRYDICDAILDGVLPKPIYKTAYVGLESMINNLTKRIDEAKLKEEERKTYLELLQTAKKRIHEATSIGDLIKKNIKKDGKYIYFCPPVSEDGVNDINTIMLEIKKYFLEMGLTEDDIVLYCSTSEMGIEGKNNQKAFYNDTTLAGENVNGKLRVMFAINQYNEGIHAPNIDGVIMGRGTSSDIVFFEQLGRALAVRGETKEKYEVLERYSIEELLLLCKERELVLPGEYTKEDIIELLLAPVVIDLTNNIDFIRDLEDNLRKRVREIQDDKTKLHREIKIKNLSFDIVAENIQLYELLQYVMDRLALTWEDKYELAKKYYEAKGHLKIPARFRTFNGVDYDENGIKLGIWIGMIRSNYKDGILSQERVKKLNQIGMQFRITNDMTWEDKYQAALAFNEYYGHFVVPPGFKTINGIDYDENGFNLIGWKNTQKTNFKKNRLTPAQRNKLSKLDFELQFKNMDDNWDERYKLAKIFFDRYGHLLIKSDFKTKNGIDYDEEGFALGIWIFNQRQYFKRKVLSEERCNKLFEIGFVVDIEEIKWEKMYQLIYQYYIHYGNVDIATDFKTKNGFEPDDNGLVLNNWIQRQKILYYDGKLEQVKAEKLSKLGIMFDYEKSPVSWDIYYKLATEYYNHNHNLFIPVDFKTINGYEFDENGTKLGRWYTNQRTNYRKGTLSKERLEKLLKIGMSLEFKVSRLSWDEMIKLTKNFFDCYGHTKIPRSFKTLNGVDYDDEGFALGIWLSNQKELFKTDCLDGQQINDLIDIGIKLTKKNKGDIWHDKYQLAKAYYNCYGHLKVPRQFKTINGTEYNEDGIALGLWIHKQRRLYQSKKISEERMNLLLEIGMIFSFQPQKEDDLQNSSESESIDDTSKKL